MEFNKLVFAGLSIGCLAAAAGGSYLAVRQNASADASASGAPAALVAPVAPGAPVTESEGIITPDAPKPDSRSVEPVAPARPASRIV